MYYDGERLVSGDDGDDNIEEHLRALADSDLQSSDTAEQLLKLVC